ncbi:MAG TPA: pyrroloquinoline quinone-dependent dehydrogenase [Rhizomicrobium sp.]|nr:pyrroloquinoline quinone-dependent dehydrogenase [Rhizomicrobium sp.]
MKRLTIALTATCLCAGLTLSLAAAAPSAGDWVSYGYDSGGGRFSPLTQITPAIESQLQVAWTYHMNPTPQIKSARIPTSTTTPLQVDGVLYLGTPYGRVVALDSASGKQLWAYELPGGDQPPFRGLAYWPGDGKLKPRLIFGSAQGKLIALDAKTGAPAKGFGTNGVVETKTPAIMNGLPNAYYGYSSPANIYKNLAIIGSRVQEAPSKGAAGDVRAWDVRTGKLAWTFHSIPRPGEKFHETWEGDSWRQRSGVNVWNMLTVDAKRGIAYLPFAAPTFDRYGGDHKGANLFSDSLVAVNASTGKYLWHFQVTHHDIWDYDLDTPPVLLEVKKDGPKGTEIIPAVAAMNKSALLFILNRVTGEPIFGVTETPVPPSPVASETASPTQPIPNKPPQLARNSFDLSEVTDVTPEHRAACQALIDKDHLTGSRRFEPIPADHAIIRFPGGEGGPEWAGGAFDPKLGLFIVNTNNFGYIEKLIQQPGGEWNMTSGRFWDPKTHLYCQQPPWGMLTAVNVNSGDIAWQVNLGISDLLPEGKKDTGRPSNGGPIVTAGGVTFIGGTDDQRFRAFDSKTGKQLWTYRLDYSAHATPITYRGKDGRQYVAIVATGGSYLRSPDGGDSLIVFALPK